MTNTARINTASLDGLLFVEEPPLTSNVTWELLAQEELIPEPNYFKYTLKVEDTDGEVLREVELLRSVDAFTQEKEETLAALFKIITKIQEENIDTQEVALPGFKPIEGTTRSYQFLNDSDKKD